MKRTVIGLVGPIASGKSEVAKYLKTLGFNYHSLSDRVREEAVSRGLELSRENLQNVGNDLRESFGGSVLAQRTLELIGESDGLLVIDAIRNPAEIDFLREALDVHIIGITASTENRLQWYLNRAEQRGEDGLSEADFFTANDRDLGVGEGQTGQQVGLCMEMADYVIPNIGSKKGLLEDVDYYLILELGFSPEGARRAQEKK